jgi:hypothetical protein
MNYSAPNKAQHETNGNKKRPYTAGQYQNSSNKDTVERPEWSIARFIFAI